MRRIGTFFIIALLSMFFCTGTVVAVTVFVNVYEKEGNITPLHSASLYANGALVGKTDNEGNIEFSHPGTENVEIIVQKIGYSPWNGEIGMNTTTLLVEMSRKKVPLIVQVYDTDTMTPLQGAHVSVRDVTRENTTSTNTNGTASFIVTTESAYTVTIEATNYHMFSSQVEVGFDQKTVQALLFRDDRFSVLVKDGDSGAPLPGAMVLVDGADRGVTDLKGAVTLALPREKVHTIQVRLGGYEDYNQQQIAGKDEAFLTIPLKKSPYSVFVSVYNEEKDPVEGASILLNGAIQGTTNKYGRLQLINLTFGNYSLEVRNPGYTNNRQSLVVSTQGEDIVVDLMYQHANISIKTLEGGSFPVTGATIFMNGEEKGQTDEMGTLPVSVRLDTSYIISAEKAGYNPSRVERTVTSVNETSPVYIHMEKGIDWLMIGIICAVGAAGCIWAAGIVRKKRGSGKIYRRGGGL